MPRSLSLHALPHLPPAHHETSKRDSPNEPWVKGKATKRIPDSNSNLVKSMTHHTSNQDTDYLVSHNACKRILVLDGDCIQWSIIHT
jgi:hypothetical protein